jgi:hypothetical protein
MLLRCTCVLVLLILNVLCVSQINAQNLSDTTALKEEIKAITDDSFDVKNKTAKTSKTEKKGFNINWYDLPYTFDDLSIIIGITNSNLYYSNHYRELSFTPGFSIGAEDFFPVFNKAFLHVGLKYTQLGFEHSAYAVKFTTHNIDIPFFLSYELPELRSFDLRLLIGTRFLFRTGSTTRGNYPPSEDIYRFRPSQFSPFDFGFVFGLSAEYQNFYTSLRGYTGMIKLAPDDTGMNTSYSIDFGYFIFRNLRNKN